ncbi:MAG: ImmA/IrrE family metallo-endopeptidase [Chloroflexaceae bacterium]|nr:ImmA/IrrE family metallo-endopeptidase [Chloroflexaceae bacterium]
MTIGERIRSARRLEGMSQEQLASNVGVSAMAISKYERNEDVPSSGVLLRLARALEVSIEYFFRTARIRLSAPQYRRRASLSESQCERIIAQVQEWVERYIEVEHLLQVQRAPDLPASYPVSSVEDAEQAASSLREHWKVGEDAIENVLELLEDHGIKVGVIDGPDGFDALTLWANDTIPVIVVKHGIPGDRQRFCLAHELGHLVMDVNEHLDNNQVEKLANRFAGALLLPPAAARQELGDQRQNLDMYELGHLKRKYGISMQASIYRAKDLGILTAKSAQSLFKIFNKNGWKREEPGAPLPAEEPQRFKMLVIRALTEDVISEGRAAELFGVPLSQFRQKEAERYGEPPAVLCD